MPSFEVTKKFEESEALEYYSGQEFENLEQDLEKSICDSVGDLEEDQAFGKDHLFQPFDFFTSRKTKRFFHEDIMNLTRASTNKDYVKRLHRQEIEKIHPHIHTELLQSESVYNEYLARKDQTITQPGGQPRNEDEIKKQAGGRYANVHADSPTWRNLRKRFRMPEVIQVQMEKSLIKEIPEVSKDMRKAAQIPLNIEIDRNKIKKEYRQFLRKQSTNSSDSEYEQANLQELLKKKKNKGAATMSVLKQVEARLAENKDQQFRQYGQRTQHIQI